MTDRLVCLRVFFALAAALMLGGACNQFLRISEEPPLGRSCQLNSDCNEPENQGYYCTREGYCDRDCKYDPAAAQQLDCPGGCTCSVLGQCVTTEGTSCNGGQP